MAMKKTIFYLRLIAVIFEIQLYTQGFSQELLPKKNGYTKVYFDSTQRVEEEGKVRKHLREGVWKYYWLQGGYYGKCLYEHGLRQGFDSLWDADGQIAAILNYKNGLKDGQGFFYSYGGLTSIKTYRAGELILDIEYSAYRIILDSIRVKLVGIKPEDRVLVSEIAYSSGLPDGKFVLYDDSGKKMVETTCHGKMPSDTVSVYENGILVNPASICYEIILHNRLPRGYKTFEIARSPYLVIQYKHEWEEENCFIRDASEK
jgi:antitoxin component YwqK of YwqJK toxin-antitoxin module